MAVANIVLTLPEEKQIEVEKGAAAAGMDLASFILNAVDEKLETRSEESEKIPCYGEWSEKFRGWISSHRSRNPQLDDSRASIYN